MSLIKTTKVTAAEASDISHTIQYDIERWNDYCYQRILTVAYEGGKYVRVELKFYNEKIVENLKHLGFNCDVVHGTTTCYDISWK